MKQRATRQLELDFTSGGSDCNRDAATEDGCNQASDEFDLRAYLDARSANQRIAEEWRRRKNAGTRYLSRIWGMGVLVSPSRHACLRVFWAFSVRGLSAAASMAFRQGSEWVAPSGRGDQPLGAFAHAPRRG